MGVPFLDSLPIVEFKTLSLSLVQAFLHPGPATH